MNKSWEAVIGHLSTKGDGHTPDTNMVQSPITVCHRNLKATVPVPAALWLPGRDTNGKK